MDKSESSFGTRFGDYVILGKIASGGMGVVYKARQLKADRIVALKMIKSGHLAGDEEIRRFQSEARAAAKLDHPNIVPIFDVGKHNEQHYFSMAYVEGVGLDSHIKQGILDGEAAASLVRTIAAAIQYSHENGIVHRDLKPANVLIDAAGQPRITDFGLAKGIATDSSLTASGQAMGTPGYMPPEQATGRLDAIGPRSDIYSIGATLYCLVTGRPPFHASSAIETIRQMLSEEPVSPRQLNPSVAKDLETICLKCLEKERAKRYHSAAALVDDLDRFLNHDTINARPAGQFERGWRWCRRNPSFAALIGSLVIGFGLTSFLALRMRQAKNEALSDAATIKQQRTELALRTEELGEQKLQLEQTLQDRNQAVRDLQTQVVELYRAKGQFECDQGRIDHGLLHFVRALESSPGLGDSAAQEILSSIDLWRRNLNILMWQQPTDWRKQHWHVSPDGLQFLTSEIRANKNHVTIRDIKSGLVIGKPIVQVSRIALAGFDRNGQGVITVSYGKTALHTRRDDGSSFERPAENSRIHYWNAPTGEPSSESVELPSPVSSATLSGEGALLCLKFHDSPSNELAQVWSVDTPRRLHTLTIDENVVDTPKFLFAPDSNEVSVLFTDDVSGGFRQQIWNLASGKPTDVILGQHLQFRPSLITGAHHMHAPMNPATQAAIARWAPPISAISSDGLRVAEPDPNRGYDRVLIRNTQTQALVGQSLRGSFASIGQPIPHANYQSLFHRDHTFFVVVHERRAMGWYLAGEAPDHIMRVGDRNDNAYLKRLKLWVEVATGMVLSTTGEPYQLTFEAWQERQRELRQFAI